MSRPSSTSGRLPPEYWIIAGIALSASGHFHVLVAIVALYLLLKRARPDMESELLMIVSGFWGAALVEAFNTIVWGRNLNLIWEQVFVTGAATMLAYTRHRGWARFLLVYCIFGALLFLLAAIRGQKSLAVQRFVIARAILYLLGLWLTARWLRRQKQLTAPLSDSHVIDVKRG